ncbi:MAG: pyruvate kinase [Clostridia bacterium]|nr:pyruvate kinase [Clostridia bacterium]
MRKTKIICTLGPATEGKIDQLIENGMDAARLNFSHETHEIHLRRIKETKQAREKLNKPIPLIIDTRGPEMRIGVLSKKVTLKQGQIFTLVNEDLIGDEKKASISNKNLYLCVKPTKEIFIDDGRIRLEVTSIKDKDIICKVTSGGVISSKKGVNVHDCETGLPFISESDIKDIEFALDNDFDYIALSFVRKASDIYQVRTLLKKKYKQDVKIIAKIENQEAVRNIDEIIDASDSIMIARGDLGIELPISEVPVIQKKLIKKCYSNAKPVIVATQMLESMTDNPLPTRAEVSDVANAVYDGTSVVMLSGETAAGDFPIESLRMMVQVINDTEADIDYRKRFDLKSFDQIEKNVLNIISKAAVVASFEIDAKAIVVPTRTGNSARMLSSYRPKSAIVAITVKPEIQRQLNMSWGIMPMLSKFIGEQKELYENAMELTQETGLAEKGDIVVLTGGIPTGSDGKTNMIKLHKMGDKVINE